ncbi:isopeptide-forming domain-containing fimbrial protein [Nocardioides conyzicola]
MGLVTGMLTVVAALVSTAPAYAAGTPDLQLTGGPAASVLYGRTVPVALTASLPSGAPKGYNLAYRVVLPAGTRYVGGSAGTDGEPTVLADKPTSGRTTLIWPNVDDLVASSGHTLSFDVDYDDTGSAGTPRYDVGDQLAITSGAYISTQPRDETDFNGSGQPVGPGAGTYTGSADLSTTTDLTAIQIRKSEPHPEGEIPRGVHDHQTVYTLTVTNNDVNPTNGVWVEDYLPAGLEFLGCAATPDHTTAASTNAGSAEEYPGAGPIVVTHPTAAEKCTAPDLVETISADPDGTGPLPSDVYTHVRWNLVGDFAPGQVTRLTYAAAIPIRENTMAWPGATPATTGAQTSNLDNNSGDETYDEQPLLNGALAHGSYQAPGKPARSVQDEGTLLRTAEDLAIQKSNDNGGLEQGDYTRWTIDLQASEYRYVDDVVIQDTVPDGLCPLDGAGTNLTTGNSADDSECDGAAGREPSTPYTSVVENADGTFTITWDFSTVPALTHLAPSATRQITFWTRTRADYQQGFESASPVLSNDAVTNSISTYGNDFIRCAPADPSCTGPGTKIWATEADGEPDTDVSGSGKAASGPVIDKTVGSTYPSSGDCNDATYGETLPEFGPGDFVCWDLKLVFPQNLDTHSQDVFDVLPAGIDYVAGSWQPVPGTGHNSVTVGAIDTSEAGRLRWPIGGGGTDVDTGGQVFEVTIKTQVGSPLGHHSGDVEGNLQKFSYENTAGKAFTLRDKVDFKVKLPELGVTKTADDDTVEAGQAVHYTVGVPNTGAAPAEDARIWDVLPTGIGCSAISAVSDGGACASGRITWTGVDVAAGATKNLTYTLTVPVGVSPAVTYTNHVGVVEYGYTTNSGSTYQLVPANTTVKDPTLPTANMPAAEATEDIRTPSAGVVKTRTTSVDEAGNNASQATIGEVVTYTVTTTIPKGTTVYGATVKDPLGVRQTLVPGSLCVNGCTLDGAPFGGVTESPANTVVATLPSTYQRTVADGVLVMTFQATVLDVAANTRGTSLGNTATLGYTDQDGANHTRSGSVSTTIVEPKLVLAKSHTPSGTVVGGQVLDFTVTASSASGTSFSAAHDVVVTDVVPAGTEPVDGSGTPIADGATVWSPGGGTWDATSRTITWTSTTTPALAGIDAGTSVALPYRVRLESAPVAGTTYTNVADGTTSSLPGTVAGERTSASSTNPGDYQAHATDAVTVALPTITKTVTPDPVTIGSGVTWHLAVTVPAHVKVYDATVADAVPSGYDVDTYGAVTCTSGCPGGDPAIATLPLAGGTASSTVAAWYLGDLAATSQPRVYDLVLTGHVRDTYRGTSTKVKDGDTLSNAASVSSNRHDVVTTDPTTVPSGFDDQVTSTPVVNHVKEPRLAIDKSVSVGDGATVKPGQALTYTVTVTNTGTWPAYDVLVTDQPDGKLVDVVPVTGAGLVTDGWTAGDPDLAWTVPGPIAPGGSVTLTYTAAVAPAGVVPPSTTVHNTATVDTFYGFADRTTRERTYHGPSDSVDLNVIPYADVEITKTADHASYHGSDVITWTLTVTNHGLSPAANVVVTDPIPAKATFQSATPASGSCTFASPTVTCNLGTVPSGATRVITVKATANGLPPANQTTDPHAHQLTVAKVEQVVTLPAGQSSTVDLACAGSGYMSDGAAEIMHVDQGTGSPTDVVVGRASTLTANGYRFSLTNGTTGQAQVKVFGTCLPHDTEVTEGHSHGLDVGAAKTLDTGVIAAGRHSFTIPVSADHRAVAPGIELQSGNARLVGSEPVAGGWRFTVEALTSARATLSLRELGTKTLGAAPSGHQHELTFQHVVRTVSVPDGESVQRVTCPDGSKGIVATYDLPAGVVLLGNEPQPINRDFRLLNTTGHAVDVVLDLECLSITTGPALDEDFTLVNTATVASSTYDPDLSNNSATATSTLTVSAGSAGSVAHASAMSRTLEIGAKGKRATVTVTCAAAAASCAGTLQLTARVRTPGHGSKRVVIGTRAYHVRSGARVELGIKVKHRFHRAIRSGRVHGYRFG